MKLSDTDARPAVEAIVPIMLEATRALAPLDVRLARDAVLDTIPMAIYLGDSDRVSVVEVAEVARSLALPDGVTPTTADLLLDAARRTHRGGPQRPRRRCSTTRSTRRDRTPSSAGDPRHQTKACWVAMALSDDDAVQRTGHRVRDPQPRAGRLPLPSRGAGLLGRNESCASVL